MTDTLVDLRQHNADYGFDGDYRKVSAPTVAAITAGACAALLASSGRSLAKGKPASAAVSGGTGGREKAISEAARVLRPGGRLVLVDIFFVRQYARRLRELGWTDVTRRNLGWRMWWGPGLGTRLLTATKPV